MNNKEITDSIESMLEGRSDEVKKSIIDFFVKQLQEEQMQVPKQEHSNTQIPPEPLPLSSVPEPSLRVKHILKIQNDLADAEETLTWLVWYAKTENLNKFLCYVDYFLEFIIKNLTKEHAIYILRKALIDYDLPIMPTKLVMFNEFVKQFGAYTMSDKCPPYSG
jgi:hypothetical protein